MNNNNNKTPNNTYNKNFYYDNNISLMKESKTLRVRSISQGSKNELVLLTRELNEIFNCNFIEDDFDNIIISNDNNKISLKRKREED